MVNRMETLGAKVPEDLSERIEEYRATHGLNTSQTIRQLVRIGLEAEENPHTITLPLVLLWFGTLAIATQYASASGLFGPAGIVTAAAGIALLNDDIRDWFNNLHARFTNRDEMNGG